MKAVKRESGRGNALSRFYEEAEINFPSIETERRFIFTPLLLRKKKDRKIKS